jgi:hypothetical protein
MMCFKRLFASKGAVVPTDPPVIVIHPEAPIRTHAMLPPAWPEETKTQTKECIICMTPITSPGHQLECGHEFHATCIAKWLERTPSCPLCRQLHNEHPELIRIRHIADLLVSENMVTREDAQNQVDTIKAFFNGTMSYAEMRAIAG